MKRKKDTLKKQIILTIISFASIIVWGFVLGDMLLKVLQ